MGREGQNDRESYREPEEWRDRERESQRNGETGRGRRESDREPEEWRDRERKKEE